MTVRTGGGFILGVDTDWRGNRCTGITLTGPVREVYTGTIDLDLFGNDLSCE